MNTRFETVKAEFLSRNTRSSTSQLEENYEAKQLKKLMTAVVGYIRREDMENSLEKCKKVGRVS